MWQRKIGLWFVVAVVTLGVAPVASAGHGNAFYELCLDEAGEILPEIPLQPVPVGCELTDCCPACVGSGPLTWRIRLASELFVSIILQFENLSPEATKQLTIKGNAKWVDSSHLQIGKGETILGAFTINPKDRPPVAIPHLFIDKAPPPKGQKVADKDAERSQKEVGKVELLVEQMLGPVLVNEFTLSYRLRPCPLPGGPSDQIKLANYDTDNPAVVVLDGRRHPGCVNDEVWKGNNLIDVGNLLSNGRCNSEVIVFSEDHAMRLVTSVTDWIDPPGDLLRVDLTPKRFMVPVSVWLAVAGVAGTAEIAVAQADFLYNTNKAGIGFTPTYHHVSLNPAAVAGIGIPSCTAEGIAALTGSGFFIPNQLNVYYVNAPVTGYNCSANRNIIVIGTIAYPETLAHEFGHSFSLNHVNRGGNISVDYNDDGKPDFTKTNMMWDGSVGRTDLSVGQCFRMNINPNSIRNTNSVRPIRQPAVSPKRYCPDPTVSPQCPWLGLNAAPK